MQSMAQNLSSLSVSFVVLSLSGSVGVIHIFASHATKSNAVEIMFQGNLETSCPNVQVRANAR